MSIDDEIKIQLRGKIDGAVEELTIIRTGKLTFDESSKLVRGWRWDFQTREIGQQPGLMFRRPFN